MVVRIYRMECSRYRYLRTETSGMCQRSNVIELHVNDDHSISVEEVTVL